jgi:hypothetical protein
MTNANHDWVSALLAIRLPLFIAPQQAVELVLEHLGVQAITATDSGNSTYNGSSSSNQSLLDVVFTGVIVITTSDSAGDQSSTNLTLTTK